MKNKNGEVRDALLHHSDRGTAPDEAYLGAAVVLQWSNLPEDIRKSLLQQADAVGGLPMIPDLHEQIQALIRRVRAVEGGRA